MSLSMKKSVLLVFVAAALSSTAYYFYPKPEPLVFATEPVQKGKIEETVLATGILQASRLVAVGAQVSGKIEQLKVQLGDEVKQGDVIAQIDSLTQQNNLKEANASLIRLNAQIRAKQAQLKLATSEFERQKNMKADNATTQADYESAQTTLTVYQAELEQLKAELAQANIALDNAKLNLSYTTIVAPFDGTVVYTAVEEGQTVNANQTTPTIIELAQLNTMTIKAQISEADVINVQNGLPVYFTILGKPNKRFNATLKRIEPGPTIMTGDDKNLSVSNDSAIYYHGVFDVENNDRLLRIGMTTQVSIVLAKADNALLVPAQVLMAKPGRGQNYQVPVLVDGQQVLKDVKVGINNKVYAEILDGLVENDLIILGTQSANSSMNNARRMQPRMRF